jgi:hypothetical protein
MSGRQPGCSDRTIRRRLAEWAGLGLAEALHAAALRAYDQIIGLELSDVAVDGCLTKAPCGGERAGPSPVDRRKGGLKRWVASDGHGIPLGIASAGANRHDSPLLVVMPSRLDPHPHQLRPGRHRPAHPGQHLRHSLTGQRELHRGHQHPPGEITGHHHRRALPHIHRHRGQLPQRHLFRPGRPLQRRTTKGPHRPPPAKTRPGTPWPRIMTIRFWHHHPDQRWSHAEEISAILGR